MRTKNVFPICNKNARWKKMKYSFYNFSSSSNFPTTQLHCFKTQTILIHHWEFYGHRPQQKKNASEDARHFDGLLIWSASALGSVNDAMIGSIFFGYVEQTIPWWILAIGVEDIGQIMEKDGPVDTSWCALTPHLLSEYTLWCWYVELLS